MSMEGARRYTLVCDLCGAMRATRSGSTMTMAEVRADAKAQGWLHAISVPADTRDVCPKCISTIWAMRTLGAPFRAIGDYMGGFKQARIAALYRAEERRRTGTDYTYPRTYDG